MARPQTAPRVNANDEVVQVVSIDVKEGDFVNDGDVIAAVETDKSLVDVVADKSGYVLRIECAPEQKIRVGSTMLWLGEAPDEHVPERPANDPHASSPGAQPTAKARALLKELGIDAAAIPARGDRLTAADVEAWLQRSGANAAGRRRAPDEQAAEPRPAVPGELHELSVEAVGMLRTVAWHRDQAVSAYLELQYDPAPWEDYAARYAQEHKLLLSPLLPLLAYRLARLARERQGINSTLVDGSRYTYLPVNLGFTVQAGSTLYLAVVRDADQMDAARFIDALGEVQRRAMAHKLRPEESSGATVSLTSMARWNVTRHIPILPPHTSLIVAHSKVGTAGSAVLGASYDHRLLSGFDVVQALQALSKPAA